MTEHTPHVCPLCGAPRAADGTPSCSCGRRVADAHRQARTAEAAAAEDFAPVRIRPFVELQDEEESGDPATSPEGEEPPPLPVAGGADTTPASAPAEGDSPPVPSPSVDAPRASRRRAVYLLAGAAVAVLGAGGAVAGLLYDGPTRDASRPEGVRAPLPEPGSATSATAREPSASPSSASASPPSSASAGTSPSRSATPTGSAPTDRAPSATASTSPSPSASSGQPPILRLGDTGPEVIALQLRLRQVGLYNGQADGVYDADVENAVRSYQFTRLVLQDESGVYGRATRASLESETRRP